MSRKLARKHKKQSEEKKYSLAAIHRAIKIAVEMRKYTKGHLYTKKMLKSGRISERCVFCGVTPKTRKQCDFWVMTLLDRFQTVLINPDYYKSDDSEALWLRLEDQYQNIKIPYVEPKK